MTSKLLLNALACALALLMAPLADAADPAAGGGHVGGPPGGRFADGHGGWSSHDWCWYPAAIDPYPNPFIPPGQATGFWYWCDA
jgi:hypothetical protein